MVLALISLEMSELGAGISPRKFNALPLGFNPGSGRGVR
jgi:hypothetical protein